MTFGNAAPPTEQGAERAPGQGDRGSPELHERPRLVAGELFVWFITLTTLVAQAGRIRVFGFNLCGLMWAVAAGSAILSRLLGRGYMPFPLRAFLPFFAYAAARTDFASRDEIQRLGLLVSPILVGAASSWLPVRDPSQIRKAFAALFLGSVALYALAACQCRSWVPGGPWYAIAGSGMTFALLGVAAVVHSARRPRLGYAAFVGAWIWCFVTQSRMPVLVLPAALVLGRPGHSLKKRAAIAAGILLLGVLVLFPTESGQSLVFRRSYRGTLEDALTMDPAIVSSGGRLVTWPAYVEAIREGDILFGRGGVESSYFGVDEFGGLAHPHNEYIRLLFDYGVVGAVLYLSPMIYLIVLCYRHRRFGSPDVQWLWQVGWLGMVTLILLAITGNAFVYGAFIGNMLFATIGGAMSASMSVPDWELQEEPLTASCRIRSE